MFRTKIDLPKVNTNSIEPELIFDCTVSYEQPLEAITSIHGSLFAGDGKELSNFSFQLQRLNCPLSIHHDYGDKKPTREETIRFQAKAKLSPKSVSHIEGVRQIHYHKNVVFNVRLNLVTVTQRFDRRLFSSQGRSGELEFLRVSDEFYETSIEITQSDWIQKYAEQLGIGKFLLVELPSANLGFVRDRFLNSAFPSVQKDLFQVYGRLTEKLNLMETELRKGNWDLVIRYSREFFELLKLGKNNPLERDLKDMFKLRNGSDIGFDELMKGLIALFDYASKFIHEKPLGLSSLQTKPKARSEDAYLIYSLCLNTWNLIAEKI
ncbi:MAG: hypothetical protein H6577_26885 [Lewinellaceae bacterium]|nr:hypothetical protein [Saprospiraceae bacterium]MCB9341768.1 hypothetical protein [Lewinellaceae bacterium]